MPAPVISGKEIPGGVVTITTTPTPLSDDDTPCSGIMMQAEKNNSGLVYWGYDDLLTNGKVRGYIDAGAVLSIDDTVSPNSIYVKGIAGNSMYWTAKRA